MTDDEKLQDSSQSSQTGIPAFPPPGYPKYVQGFGYTIGIERLRKQAREQWERQYGEIYERIRTAK